VKISQSYGQIYSMGPFNLAHPVLLFDEM